MLGHHLIDMAGRRAEHEQAGADDGRKTEVEASKRRNEADNGKTKTCGRHFELEWTVRPADESRRHFSEEAVHYEIAEIADADDPEHVPGKQLFNDIGRFDRPLRPSNRDGGEQEADDQEGQEIV